MYAWQPGTILNGLSDRQSELSQIFDGKSYSNLLKVSYVCLEMPSDSKNYLIILALIKPLFKCQAEIAVP